MNAFTNPDDSVIRQLLENTKRIAVVGLSPKTNRPSHSVSAAMQEFGYTIIPVRPGVSEILGEKTYRTLADLPQAPDLVDIFRASKHIPEIVDTCIDLKIPAVWLQEGVIDQASALKAQASGMIVIMDRCIYKDYRRLIGD